MYDEEKDRDEAIASKRELVQKVMNEAQQKYEKYFHEYQVTGSPSKIRTARKYDDMVTICEIALQELDKGCENCLRRYRNGKEMVENLRNRRDHNGELSINIDDVIKLVEAASMF